MPEPPSHDPSHLDPPPRHAPRLLPRPYNSPPQTPAPYVPPRPASDRDTDGSARSPSPSPSPSQSQSAQPHYAGPGGKANGAAPPDPPTRRSSSPLNTIVLVLFFAFVVIVGVSFMIYNAGTADRDDDGDIAEAGTVYSDDLEIGDCIKELEMSTAVADVPGVPCSQPHAGEVVGMFEIPDGRYPGEQEVFRIADARCTALLRRYAPEAYAGQALGVAYLYPTERRWRETDEHGVTCIGTSFDGTPLSGRLTDAAPSR